MTQEDREKFLDILRLKLASLTGGNPKRNLLKKEIFKKKKYLKKKKSLKKIRNKKGLKLKLVNTNLIIFVRIILL